MAKYRRITAIVLIAMLVPAPGFAWHAPVYQPRGDAMASRIFARALNNVEQAAANIVRPQVYILFDVDVPVLSAGNQTLITGTSMGWFDTFLKELTTAPAATTTARTATVVSSPNATKLSTMPESMRYSGSSDDAESTVARSIKVTLDDALTDAKLNSTDGSFRSDGGTVTYFSELEDGDIVVTGRLVNGQIVVTKEFTPLVTGTQAAGPQTTTASTPAATSVVSSPAAFNKSYLAEYETKVKVITPNSTNTTLMGQISVRDTYVAQMNNMAGNFDSLLKDASQMDTLVLGLRRDAKAVDDAYQNMLGAERTVIELQGKNSRVDLKGNYDGDMRRAAQLDMEGNKIVATKIRTDAENTAYGNFVQKRQIFFQTLDKNPLLGLGDPGLFGSDYLFKKIRNTLAFDASNSDYVSLVRPYLEKAATEARNESTRAGAITAAGEFLEFGSPKYLRTRDAMDAEGDANGSNVPGAFAQAAEGAYEQVEGSKAVGTQITNFGLNLVAGTAWVIPGIGPFISAGVAAIQVVRDGKDLVVALLDENDARNLSGVTGYTRVLTAEDRVAAQKNQFVVSVVGLALEGLNGVKVVKGPLPTKAGGAVTDAVETAAGTAVREAPAPTGAVGDKTGVFPDAPPEPPSLPKRRAPDAELDARNIEEAAELDEAYAENLTRARAARVPEARIQQLTAKGGGPGHVGAINALYLEALAAEGKELMSLQEFIDAATFETKNRLGTLTDADYDWLRNKLAQDPRYLERLPNRGRMDGTDGFITPANADQVSDLVKNPRVAQMVDDAKSAAAAGAGVQDATGTVLVPAGSKPNPGGANAVADGTKTVILPPGAKPSTGTPTVKMDPTKTALIDNADGTPTVRIDPRDATPTVRIDPQDAAPTVRLDANKTTRDLNGTTLDPNKTTIDPNKTVITDPNKTALIPPPNPIAKATPKATAGLANELKQSLPKAQQAGQSPIAVAKEVRVEMTRRGIDSRQLTTQLTQQLLSLVPRRVSMTDLGNTTKPGVDVSLEALGVSSGEAFKMTAVNRGTAPVQLSGQGIVVEPIIGAPVKQSTSVSSAGGLTKQSSSISSTGAGGGLQKQATSVDVAPPVVTETVEAFCLERVRPVAPPGTQYRVAPPAIQKQHHGLIDILHAAQRVNSVGLLRPDSEVKSYFNFVRQWSIWTRQENFDEKQFTEEFVNQTKKNVESQNVKWTGAMQDTVKKAAPGRWRDVSAVLNEANKPKIQATAGVQWPSPVSMQGAAVEIVAGPPTLAAALRRRVESGDFQ